MSITLSTTVTVPARALSPGTILVGSAGGHSLITDVTAGDDGQVVVATEHGSITLGADAPCEAARLRGYHSVTGLGGTVLDTVYDDPGAWHDVCFDDGLRCWVPMGEFIAGTPAS